MTELSIKQSSRKTRDLNVEASYFYDNFTDMIIGAGPLGNVLPVATDALTNVWHTDGGTLYSTNINAQTLLGLVHVATGLSIASDLTNGDGLEITLNVMGQTDARFLFKVGSEPVGFYIEAQFTLADVSGVGECIVGFRKNETYQAARASYSDYAACGCVGALSKSMTQVGTGGESLVSTGVATTDAITIVYRTEVSTDGKVTFYSNYNPATSALVTTGALYELKVSQAFTFTDTLTLIPFVRFIHSSDVCDTAVMNYLSVGYLN